MNSANINMMICYFFRILLFDKKYIGKLLFSMNFHELGEHSKTFHLTY